MSVRCSWIFKSFKIPIAIKNNCINQNERIMRKTLFLMLFTATIGWQATAQCNYSIKLIDSWGDGWNGNTLDVLVNGVVVLDNITLYDPPGDEVSFSLAVNDGDEITAIYNETGSYAYENSFEVYDANNLLVGSGDDLNDITVPIVVTCPTCFAPSGLTVASLSSTTATISWSTGPYPSWNISWGLPGYTPGDGDVGTGTSATTSYQILGLTEDSNYDVYVQTDCSDEQSAWAGPLNVFTGYCTSVPDSNDRNGITNVQVGSLNYTGSDVTYLDFRNDGTADLAAGTSSNLQVTFDTGYTYNTHVWIDLNNNLVFEASELVFSGESTDVRPTTLNASFTMPADAPLGVHRMRIGTADMGQSTPNPCYNGSYGVTVDLNINVTAAPACLVPTALAVASVIDNAADVTWTAGDSETDWNISWGVFGYTPGTNDLGTAVVTTTPAYQITGLDDNTQYQFYVQADCGAEQSAWASPVSFTTACTPFGSFSENFDTTNVDEVPACWSTLKENSNNSFASIAVDLNPNAISSPNDFQFYNSGDENAEFYLVSPELTNLSNADHQLRFSYKGTGGVSLIIGTMSDPSNALTFSEVQAVTTTTTYDEYIVLFDQSYTDPYIVFKVVYSQIFKTVNLDDVSWELIPSCPKPTSLTATSITTTTADFSWTTGSSETAWNISWGTPGYSPSIDDIGTHTATTTSYQITGLDASTEYEFYVQASCDIADVSDWVGPLAFTTQSVNDNLCDALPLTIGATSAGDAYTNVGATVQPNEPNGTCWSGTSNPQTVWFSFVAPSSGNVTATTDIAGGTLNDTHIAIYEAPADCADLLTLGMEVGCDEDGGEIVGNGWTSVATMTGLTPGNTYYIQVDGYGSKSGTFGLEVHDDGYDGFVYEAGVWTPSDPSVDAGPTDDIFVVDGVTNFTSAMEVNNITVMSGATLNVEAVLTINGDITNDGNLVFVSTATGNGELAAVPGTSSITGNVTVERYMKAKRSYRMVSSAVTTSTSVHDNWQEGATSNTNNPNPGFGTHITGSTTDQMNGFDGTITGNPSMFTVNVGTQMFEAVTNTDVNTLTAGEPYLLFVRGDRSVDLTNDLAAGETVLRATGSLVTGTQTQNYATSNAGDVLMFGNPYQSAVDVNAVFAASTNLNTGYYYVYDSELGAHGAYVTVNLPGGSNTSGSDANQFLQPGQGAQAAALAAGATSVVFNEASKAPGNFTPTNRPVSANDMLTVQLFTTENFNNEGPVHDSFGIIFAEGNDNGLTPADAVKPMNFYENLGRDLNGTYLSIEQRALPQAAEVYPMYSTGYTKSDYTLKVIVEGLEANFLYLDDHFTGTSMLLEAGENSYSFRVDANDALSIATDRFSIRTAQRLGIDDNSLLAGIRLFPNPLNGDTFYINAPKLNGEQLAVSISDLTGRNIFEQTIDCRANTVTIPMGDNVASGVYLVTLTSGGEAQTYRLIKE